MKAVKIKCRACHGKGYAFVHRRRDRSQIKSGMIFGYWQIVCRDLDYAGRNVKYLCHCLGCGRQRSVYGRNLKSGASSACGRKGCNSTDKT